MSSKKLKNGGVVPKMDTLCSDNSDMFSLMLDVFNVPKRGRIELGTK